MNEDAWPMLHFGPINLWTVVPAGRFYSLHEEQVAIAWREQSLVVPLQTLSATPNENPVIRRMTELIAAR